MAHKPALDRYRLLGRSGLRVSPLALGTMAFGESWGADEAEARRIFDAYADRGGNFVDTANHYAGGESETMVGRFAAGKRDRLVLATKYSLAATRGDPNSAGNHRKSMVRAVEASLKRLGTDYIDLYYLHVWDALTPVDEVMRAFDDLVRAGKILYVGISDTPAWQISRMQMLAELRGWASFAALQIEYNLVERSVEAELVSMATELDIGVIPWSPLAGGLLSGKFADGMPASTDGRAARLIDADRVDARGTAIARAVHRVAGAIGCGSAEVALAWLLQRPTVTAPILGPRTEAQLIASLGALDVALPEAQRAELDAASAVPLPFPHNFLAAPRLCDWMMAGVTIEPRRRH